MLTALLYIVVLAMVAGVLFFLASALFGRGEELAPLPKGRTLTTLPEVDIAGSDVTALRFQQVPRGYKSSEVDWALARLAAEIDRLRGLVEPGQAPDERRE